MGRKKSNLSSKNEPTSLENNVVVFSKFANFGYTLGFIPYTFWGEEEGDTRGQIKFNESSRCWRAICVCVVVQYFYQTFLIVRCVQIYHDERAASRDKFSLLFLTTVFITISFSYWITIKYYGHHHIIINTFLETTKSIMRELNEKTSSGDQSTNSSDRSRKPRKEGESTFLHRLCLVLAIMIPLARALGIFRRPWSPELLTSVAEEPLKLSLGVKIGCAILHCYISGFAMFSLVFHGSALYCYVCRVMPILEKIRIHGSPEIGLMCPKKSAPLDQNRLPNTKTTTGIGGRRVQSTILQSSTSLIINYEETTGTGSRVTNLVGGKNVTESRSSEPAGQFCKEFEVNCHLCYSQLSVLQKKVTEVYGPWPLGFELVLIIYATVNLFLFVHHGNVRFLVPGMAACAGLIGLFDEFALVNQTSMGALASWKRRWSSIWFKKFVKTCRPISIQIGNFFYVDRGLILTIVAIIIQNTTSLILTFKDA